MKAEDIEIGKLYRSRKTNRVIKITDLLHGNVFKGQYKGEMSISNVSVVSDVLEPFEEEVKVKRGRGRPKGSKNKSTLMKEKRGV